MSKKGGSTPTPDPNVSIEAQARANRVNTYTPYSSTEFYQTPTAGYSQTPAPRTGYGSERSMVDQITRGSDGGFISRALQSPETQPGQGGQWNKRVSFSPEVQNLWQRQLGVVGDPNAYNDYQDQSFAAARRLLDPYYEQQQNTFEQQMANQGLPVGGEAYDDAYSNFTGARDRAYQDAAFNALQFGEQARMNDYNRLAQVLAQANGAPTAPLDVMGPYNAQLQGQMQNAQIAQQKNNNLWNTIGQGLGAYGMYAAMASSESYKDDKGIEEDILDKLMEVDVHRWEYLWDDREHIGPFAEEFNEAFDLPESKQINIIDMLGVMMGSIQELAKEVRELKNGVH